MTELKRALTGIDLPWLFGAYGHDLAPNERRGDWPAAFESFAAYRPLVEARELGFEAVRVWLCEAGEGIVTRDGVIEGVHPSLLEAVKALQEGARLAGLRVIWTLLDANTWAREEDALTRSIVADPDATARFAERVAAPVARALDPAVTLAVEMLHEPEALTVAPVDGREPVSWEAVSRFLRATGDAIRGARPGTLVTVGTRPEFLAAMKVAESGLDAVEVHVSGGSLPSRDELAIGSLGHIARRAVADGEDLGQWLSSADEKGYAAAFLGRLEGDLIDSRSAGRPVTAVGARVRTLLAERRAV